MEFKQASFGVVLECGRRVGHLLVEWMILSHEDDEEGDSPNGYASNVTAVPLERYWAPQLPTPELGPRKLNGSVYAENKMPKMSDVDVHFNDTSDGHYGQTEVFTGKGFTFLNSPYVPAKSSFVPEDSNPASCDVDTSSTCCGCFLSDASDSDSGPGSGPAAAEVPPSPRPQHKALPSKKDEPFKGGPALPPRDKIFQFVGEPSKSPQTHSTATQQHRNGSAIKPQLRPGALEYDDWSSENPYLPGKLLRNQAGLAGSSGYDRKEYKLGYGIGNVVVKADSDSDTEYDGLGLAHARLDEAEAEAEANAKNQNENGAAAMMQGNGHAVEGKGKGKEKVVAKEKRIVTGEKVPDIVITQV
ncbi:hypothetical protein F5Y13DRAFT_90156 [Hypoxylon sp. FL1857]|nr:hypothetical protein F5Y13DRAFT_90156 [Hypoxylon sp. FL1857]